MFVKTCSVPSDNPSAPVQSSTTISPKRKFGKKFYIAFAAVIVAVIIVAALFVPQGSAVIPLEVNYAVGEKMVYDTVMTGTFQVDNSTLPSGMIGLGTPSMTLNSQETIEVIDFDGEYYTLNHTTTVTISGKPFSISMLERMNKTGYSTYMFNFGNTSLEVPNTSVTGNNYLSQLLNKPEVKIGDTITVPFPSPSPLIAVTGDLTITFGGLEDLSVPAGNYKVFRIDIKSNNLKMSLNPPTSNSSIYTSMNISMNTEMNYQIYMEYGTLRQIKSTMQNAMSYHSSMMNYTMNLSNEMTLVQHIKP
jgi:hypothetical protein